MLKKNEDQSVTVISFLPVNSIYKNKIFLFTLEKNLPLLLRGNDQAS